MKKDIKNGMTWRGDRNFRRESQPTDSPAQHKIMGGAKQRARITKSAKVNAFELLFMRVKIIMFIFLLWISL